MALNRLILNLKLYSFFFQKNFSVLMFSIFFWEKALCKLFGKQNHFFSAAQIHIKIHKMPHNSRIDVEFYGGKYLPLTTSHSAKENQQNQFKYLDFFFYFNSLKRAAEE